MSHPYGSADVRHVPPPEPESFWPFEARQERTIAVDPLLTFQVTEIHDTWIEGIQRFGDVLVSGELHLNWPVVISRSQGTGVPLVTLTLRKIEDCRAFLQVTFNPALMRLGYRH